MNRREFVQKAAEKRLHQMIKTKGGNPDAGIIANLDYLADEVTTYGETHKFLSFETKKLIATYIDPDYRIEFKKSVITKEGNNVFCDCEAVVYWSDSDTPAGVSGLVRRELHSVAKQNPLTEIERYELLESWCRGLAASRALSSAGIGLGFKEDEDFTDAEDKEDIERHYELINAGKNLSKESGLPVPPSQNEEKKKKAEMKAKNKPEPKIEPSVALDEEKIQTEETTQTKIALEESAITSDAVVNSDALPYPISKMSLEEAAEVIINVSQYNGYKMGDVMKKQGKAAIYFIDMPGASEELKEACTVYIRSIPELMEKYIERHKVA